MKKNILLLIILVMSFGVFAQNWAPINATEKFCYYSGSDFDVVSDVLWVESFEEYSDYSILLMNNVAVPYEAAGENMFLNNQAQFLLDSIVVYDSGLWSFYDTYYPYISSQEFFLYPKANVGDSWGFTPSITATISGVDQITIFGEIDSVKYIDLSNEKQIILSKNHGVINWFGEYFIVGIEERDLGVHVLKFSDMFSRITPGDILCMTRYNWQAEDDMVISDVWKYRRTVVGIDKYSDSVHISVNSQWRYDYHNGPGSYYSIGSGYDTLKYYKNSMTEVYPNETIYIEGDWDIPESYIISRMKYHEWGGSYKTQLIIESDDWVTSSRFTECESIYFDPLCPTTDMLLFEYSEYFGVMEYEYSGFEQGSGIELEGVVDDGVQYGEMYPDDLFVGQEELSPNNNFLVYPSPAKETIKIQAPDTGEIQFQVFNISGQLVMEGSGEKSSEDVEIDISELQNGIYILQLKMDQQFIQKKFIKQN